MHSRVVWIASLVVLAVAFVSPQPAEAQVDLGGATRISFSGNITDITNARGFVAMGASRVTEGGAEFGGDIQANITANGVTGFAFFRGSYNFIGESLTVPFVSFGIGTSLGGTGTSLGGTGTSLGGGKYYPYEAGGGIKRFISESASFDVLGTYRATLSGTGGGNGVVSVMFGMSLYFGN